MITDSKFYKEQFDKGKKYEEIVPKILDKVAKEFIVFPNPYPYGVDFLIRKGKRILCGIEVEERSGYWHSEKEFPYDMINVPYRKRKFFDCTYSIFYLVIRGDKRSALLFDLRGVKNYPVLDQFTVRNPVDKGVKERFFQYPRDYAITGFKEINSFLLKWLRREYAKENTNSNDQVSMP